MFPPTGAWNITTCTLALTWSSMAISGGLSMTSSSRLVLTPEKLALKVDGSGKLRTDGHGNLVFKTAGGYVNFEKPVMYQEVAGKEHGKRSTADTCSGSSRKSSLR